MYKCKLPEKIALKPVQNAVQTKYKNMKTSD